MMGEQKTLLVLLILLSGNLFSRADGFRSKHDYVIGRTNKTQHKKRKIKKRIERKEVRSFFRSKKISGKFSNFAGHIGKDIFEIHKNILSWDSFRLVTLTFPFFVGSRMIDEKLQQCFYDHGCSKNVNQMPRWCHGLAQWSIGIPFFFFGTQAFLNRDEEFRTTSQLFIVGVPFVIFGKKLIKRFRFNACLRPWNEKFAKKERSFGGLPSGHVAEATYAAVLYGMRYGYRFALPLGALTAFVGVTFLTCNRHYLSQLVAGVGFGALYALAANKVADAKLDKDLTFRLSMNEKGGPAFGISYRF